jgi:TRAP-type C4-dicarboxylate transport system permease small subunit
MSQAMDLMLKICVGWQGWQGSRYFWIQMLFIFGGPAIPVIYTGSKGLYGYGGAHAFCIFQMASTLQIELDIFYYPILAAVCGGALCMIFVIIEIIKTTNNHSENLTLSAYQRIRKKVAVVKTSILFVVFYLLLWISVQNFQFQLIKNYDDLSVSAVSWISCTFANFNPKEPEAWKKTCGSLPKNVVNFDYVTWVILTVSGQSILIAGVYMNAVFASFTNQFKAGRSTSPAYIQSASFKSAVGNYVESTLNAARLHFLYPAHPVYAKKVRKTIDMYVCMYVYV